MTASLSVGDRRNRVSEVARDNRVWSHVQPVRTNAAGLARVHPPWHVRPSFRGGVERAPWHRQRSGQQPWGGGASHAAMPVTTGPWPKSATSSSKARARSFRDAFSKRGLAVPFTQTVLLDGHLGILDQHLVLVAEAEVLIDR